MVRPVLVVIRRRCVELPAMQEMPKCDAAWDMQVCVCHASKLPPLKTHVAP